MAGNITRTATIQFVADTSSAKAQIQSLVNSLNSAMNTSMKATGISSVDQELKQASIDAAKLQASLQSAVNVNTGKLDLTKFNDSLKTSHMSLQQYQASLGQLGSTGNAAFASLARSIATAEVPLRRSSTLLKEFSVSLANTVKWNISSSIMNGFISGIQTAFNYSEKLNDSLNRIQIVTGESAAQMAKFAEQANKSAQSLSTTTRKYTDAALIFYQQGLGDADVKARTDAVIKMANVTGDASKEVSNYMTAIWNNFDNGTSSLESFEDKIVSLGATTASSSAEIAAGLEKFAAVGNTIGLSFDYAAAALATVVAETRQSADTVGTAFRTLFSRLQGLKLGETLEDGTSLNKYSAALATVGVQIQDTSGQLKEMDTILDDLAGNWDNLTQAQKVALAQTVGGARQYTTLISLMENWDQFQKNLATEAGSEGALQKQADIYAQSWAAAKDRVTASMEGIYQTLIDDKFFINLNNGFAKGLSGLNSFIQNIGGVKTVLLSLGTVALNVFDKQITESLNNTINNIKMMTQSGRQAVISLKQEAVTLLSSTAAESGTLGGISMSNAYQQEAAAQALLIANAEKLNAQEQATAQVLLQQVQARVDSQNATAQQVDETEEAMGRLEVRIASLAQRSSDASSDVPFITTLVQQMREVNQDAEQFDGIISRLSTAMGTRLGEIGNLSTDQLKDSMQGVQEVLDSVDFNTLSQRGQDAFNDLKAAITDTAATPQTIQDAMERFIESNERGLEAITDKINIYRRELEDLRNNNGDSGRIAWLENVIPQLENYRSQAELMGSTLEQLNAKQRATGQAADAMATFMAGAGVKMYTTADNIMVLARSLTTISTLIRTVSNVAKTFSDDSKSFGEKLTALLGAIGMLTPMLLRLGASYIEVGKSIIVAKLASEGSTIAAAKQTVANMGLAASLKAIGAAALKAAPYLIALTAAVAGAIYVYNNFIKNAEHTDSLVDKHKKLEEQISNVSDSLSTLKTKAEEVRSLFDQYTSVTEALANCTQGTEEWRAKMEELYNLQNQILANNPDVAEFMTKIAPTLDAYDSSKYVNADGSINYGSVLGDMADYYQNQAFSEGLAEYSMASRREANEVAVDNIEATKSLLGELTTEGSRWRVFDPTAGPQTWQTTGFIADETADSGFRGFSQNSPQWKLLTGEKGILHDLAEITGNPNIETAIDTGALFGAKGSVDPSEMLSAFWQGAMKYGSEHPEITGLEELGEAYIQSFGEEQAQAFRDLWQLTFSTDMFGQFGLGGTTTPWETLGKVGKNGEYRTGLMTAYAGSQSRLALDTNGIDAVTLISKMIPGDVWKTYSDEQKAFLSSTGGAQLALQTSFAQIDQLIEENAVSVLQAAQAYADSNEEIKSVLPVYDELTQKLTGVEFLDEEGKTVASMSPTEAILMSKYGTDLVAQSGALDNLPEMVLSQIPAEVQKWVTSGGTFDDYTYAEIQQLRNMNWSPALEQMFQSTFGHVNLGNAQSFNEYFKTAQPISDRTYLEGTTRVAGQDWTEANHPAGVYFDASLGETGMWRSSAYEAMTMGQMRQLSDMRNKKSESYAPEVADLIYGFMPELTSADQLQQLLNFDFSRGQASIAEFQALMASWNMTIDETSDHYGNLLSTVEATTPALSKNTEAFGNMSNEAMQAIEKVNQGTTITQKEYQTLQDEGFDLSGLSQYGEGYRGSIDLTRPLQQMQAIKDMDLFSTDTFGHTRIREGTGYEDAVARALGFEGGWEEYQEQAAAAAYDVSGSTSGKWNSDIWNIMATKGGANFDAASVKPQFNANGLYYLLAQYGTMYEDAMTKYDAALTDKYAQLMAQKQAELEGISLSGVELKSITNVKSMHSVLTGRRAVTQASGLSSLYNKENWSATDLMTAQQYGLNIDGSTSYEDRQAAIAAKLQELNSQLEEGSPYAAEMAGYLQAIGVTDFSEATASLTQFISQLQNIQTLLDNFNLDNLASNSVEAWDALTKKIGLTRQEFSKLSKEEQRTKLGEAQRLNLSETLTQQQALASAYETQYGFNGYADQATLVGYDPSQLAAYQSYLSVLQQIATTRQNMQTSKTDEENDIISMRVAELDARIAALQAANDAEQAIIDKYSTASTNLVNAITDGALSAVQRLQIAGVEGGAEILAAWDAAGTSGERAIAAAQMTAQYTEAALQQQAKIQTGIRGAQDWFGGRSAGDKLLSTSAWSSTDKMEALWQNDKTLSDQAINELITADKKVRDSLGANATTADYATAMKAELATMSSDAQAAWDQIAASGKDTLSGIFVGLGEEAREAAETATEAWLSAFEAIANARAILMQGGNLLETLAGNPETLLQLARGTAPDGDIAGQMQRIVQGTTSGTLKASDLNSNLSWQDYKNNQLAQYNLNATADGWGAQFAQDNATVIGDKYRLANQLGLNVNNPEELSQLNKALIDSYSKILQANGIEARAAETLARKAVETGEGYDEVKKAAGNLSSAIDYSTGLYALQQKSLEDTTAIQAAGDVTKMSYGGRTQEQWTKLQDAISKGQTAAKTSTDQSSWEQQMLASGYGDALQLLNEAGIGFGNVNTAAERCAAALSALASAAEAAAKKEAQDRGYTQNAQGKWQKDYTGGVTQSELEKEYGDSWQSVANTLTAVTDDKGNIIKYTGVYVDEGLTSALQTIITQSQQAQASLEQIQLQKLSDAAAALGTDVGNLESYIQSIALAEGTLQSMTDTWGKWEDMALSTQTMLAEAAIEYNKSIAAIEKISEADALFKAIDKEAGTDATALKEKAAAYRELADAVNNYFLDGLADPQFVQDNLQLIKDWANGSIEAMEQLEAKLLAVFNEQYELNISSDSLAELNNWANGLQFGEALTQEQLDWINNFQKINNLTDEQLAKMADLCGVTLEFNHESVEIPRNTKAANEQLAKMVNNAQAIDKSTREGAEKYAQQVAAIQNANEALKKVKKSVEAAGQAGEKSYKDLAKQGANLAALAAAPAESFIGYKGILDANTAKTAAWNDALQNVSQSGTSLTDALNQANKSLEAMGEKPINVPVEVDTSKADADLAQVTDLEGLIHYLEEHEEVDPAVLEQEGIINYSYTGDAPSYHTEEETAANNTTFSGGGEVTAGPFTIPYHFSYTADGDTTAAVPVLDGASGGSGNRGGGGGGGRRGGRGGGGGGGGGRRQDYTGDKKRKEQRYVTNTNQLEDLQHILEKVNKAEERTYGRNRIKQMQAKAKALEDVAKKQKDLYNEAVKYAAQDKKDLQNNDLAKKMGLKFQFDENGTILNRDEIEQKMVDYYNSFTNGRNEKGEYILKDNSEAGEAKFKMMQEDYAELEKLLGKYDESQDKIKEYWEAYMDSINEAYDVIVEMANYKVEVQVEVSDEAVQLLDHMLKKIEDDAYKAAEAISYMGQQAFEYQAQDKINNKGIHDILAHHDGKSKYFDSEGKEHTTTKFTESDIQGILNGDSKAWDKLMGMEKEFTQDELDSLQEMINSKVEATEKLMETQKQVYAQIGVVFDEATDKMERQMSRIEHLQNITDSYANITDLVGRKKLGMTNEMLNELDLAKVDQSLSKLRGAKELMDTQKNMMSTLQNQFVQNADGTWSNNLKATYKDANGKEISRQDYWKQQADELRKQGITNSASKADIKTDKTTLKDLKVDKKAQDAEYKQQLKDLQAQKKALDSELAQATKAEEDAAKATKATSVSGLNKKLDYFGHGGIFKAFRDTNIDLAAMVSGKKTGGGSRTTTETIAELSRPSKDIQKELKAVEDQIKKTEAAQKKYDETQQQSIDAAQAKLDKDQQEATLMQEKLDLYDKLASSDSVELTERDIGLLTDQMENMEDAIQESTENFYSSWEEAIQKISELYTNMIGRAIEDASDKLAGKLGSLDELADRFAKSQELDQRYVEDYEKIYEFSKLNRDIINSIDETDNVKAKQALAEYQKEINQLEEDETEISKYQIENARRRYELLLAQLALEEARDAKSQVQMTRSSTGEWSYVYTADESQVAEAEQNYEDKLFAMQQANAEYINELQQNIIDLQQRMMEEIQQLRVEDYASYEEYMEAVNAIKEHYGVLMNYNMEQLGIVFDEQTRLYDEDWTKYSEATGYKISTDENYLNKWNETALAKQTGFDTMEEMHENFNKTSDELLEKSSEAYQTWSGLIDTAMIDAGTSTDDFATKLNTDVGQMNADAAEAAAAMEALGDAAEDAFSRMTEALSNWQAEYSAAIEDMLEKNEALAKSFNELLKAWSGYNDTVGQEPGDEGGGDEETPTGGEDPTGGETPTGGDSKGSGYAVIDKGYRYYIYEEDGSNTGKSDVHWGFGSKSKDRTYNLSRKIHAGGKDLYELADHPGKFLSGPSASHKHIYWNEGGRRGSHIYEPSRRSSRRRRRSSRRSYTPRRSSRGSDLRDRGYPSSTEGYRPRSSGGCFEAGTQILMADLTTKNIEDIKINDMVMAYNEELMTYEPCAVIESYTHHNTPALMEVYLNDGSVIKMTPAHPILTLEGWKSRDVNMSLWEHRMSVDYLTLEDTIIGHNGFYSIVEIREYALPENYDTYNLAIEKCHTFIADNIVVHNTVSKYASGGYTGDWGTSDGRIAILHEKEIVLNKEDTANFLTGIGILRDITKAIDLNALASAGYLANLGAASTVSTGTLEQEVHITAEFPNATDKESIKEAFNDLINLASQYAGRM